MNRISQATQKARTLYREHLWRGRLVLAAVIIVFIMVVVRVSLPYTIVYSSIYWLGKQGIEAQIEDIVINVARGSFAVINASGTKDGDRVFHIGKASIDWAWRPLAARTIHVKGVELDDFSLVAEQHADALVVGGVVITSDGSVEATAEEVEDAVAWGASLDQINFRDLGFCLKQFDSAFGAGTPDSSLIDYCGDVDLATWRGAFSLASTGAAETESRQKLTANGSLSIEKLKLFNNKLDGTLLYTDAISLSDLVIDGLEDIKLKALAIDQLTLLQRAGHARHKHAAELARLAVNGISVEDLNTVSIGSVTLQKPMVSMNMDASGRYGYEQWLPPQKAEDTAAKTAETAAATDVYRVRLSAVRIDDSEICYQQAAPASNKSGAIDYCMNLSGLEWNGDIAVATPEGDKPPELSLDGSLTLSGLVTTNNLLDRDLVSFDQLAAKQILVKGLDDAAIGTLDLGEFAALELTAAEDQHTLTIGKVSLAAFSYRDNTLSVKTAAVNDLGAQVTQNADGSLDFEKWKPEPGGQETHEDAATGKSTTEPVRIKVDEFSLDTKRMVGFRDLSVTPNLEAGLDEMHFSIKNLDSAKPDQESPVELSAKTTRHATIDIKGVVMPFQSKPSFDATGKITGLDLRVASPKVEQAVGHIIKSGQMDADLTLLADKGQLDSKIALVLHHFNLKAKSKEDAEELNKTFGMPINQSLVLLKDKKDRIKLTIPITGDINNPDFDPTNAIIKATTKATTVTLVTFYTPYGLAFAGGNILFDLATALNFDPLVFEPGSSELSDANREQLAKLAELLRERPGVHLTLCGYTNLDDRSKITTEIIDKEKIKPPAGANLEKLQQLGNERQQTVKNHLVDTGKIPHNRLILCAPEHSDAADAISGVEISI